MIDWDDVRFFLAVARGGSVRAAAEQLRVNHSTVLRRIAQLEQRLGARLFERLPAGYKPTEAGNEVRHLAERMEAASRQLEARVLGRDQAVRGSLRVTLPPPVATQLLLPDLVDFARLHPEVEMEVLPSDDLVNLTNRQADVAIRVVYEQGTLPQNLHGLKGPEVFGGTYLARDLLTAWRVGTADTLRWVLQSFGGTPDEARAGEMRVAGTPFRTADTAAQTTVLKEGFGMATLPCFVGDAEPSLVRVPGTGIVKHGTLWLLTQGETRKTRRVQLFVEFIARRLAVHAPLLAGLQPSGD